MRIANFRDDVLWAICYQIGVDPQKNLDDDQAAALVSFINSWVRRTYDAQDYPEWTKTLPFRVPVIAGRQHIIPYSVIPYSVPAGGEDTRVQIGRVFKVYLTDPQLTPLRPLDTPHTMRPEGVHVGFEHGQLVWIKFIEQPPQFTSKVWVPNHTYPKGELAYSPISGQCYKSKGNDNRGHDPSGIHGATLLTETVEEHAPPTMSIPARTKIIELGLTGTNPGPDPDSTPESGAKWTIAVGDSIFSSASVTTLTHTATGSETLSAITTSLAASLDALLPTYVSITADVSDPATPFIRIENATDFSVMGGWSDAKGASSELPQILRQTYVAEVPAVPRSRQITNVTLPIEMVMGDTVYSITFRSPDTVEHYVEYQGLHTDGAAQILNGLANQITASADPWLATVQPSLDLANSMLSLSIEDEASIEAVLAPGAGNNWWLMVEFPFELIDQVVRGAYANELKEEGQTDKGVQEEQVVPQEMAVSVNSNVKSPMDRMTDQVGISGGTVAR